MLADGLNEIVAVEVEFSGLDDDAFHFIVEQKAELLFGGGAGVGDHRADAGLNHQQSLVGQSSDCFLGGIGIDAQLLAEHADGWKFISRFERSCDDRLFDGVHHLVVGVRPGLELHAKR